MYNTIFKRTWSPWDELTAMERVFDDIFRGAGSTGAVSRPKSTHWVKDDVAHVALELPGVDKKDVEISIEGKTLTISGARKTHEAGKDETVARRERWHGEFTKTYTLPFSTEHGKVKAEFSNGILTVTIPRAETEKPRKIAVK